MELGFSHAYHLNISLLPWEKQCFADRLDKTFTLMKATGATSFRPHIPWNSVEPVIESLHIKISDVTDRLVDKYVAGKMDNCAPGGNDIFWEETDLIMNKMVEHGINPFICLGVAYFSQLPLFETNKYIVRFNPSNVTLESYLARLYLHTRAVVRRYKSICKRWQLENEINGAGIHTFLGWRKGYVWFSRSVQTRVIEIIHRAVKQEDPEAITAHNFMIPLNTIPYLYTYKSQLKKWDKYMDIVGVDPYPNFMNGDLKNTEKEFNRIIKEVKDQGVTKPIYIMETGYSAKPAIRGFSEERQKEYYETALNVAEMNKIKSLYFYCFTSQEGAPGAEWCSDKETNDIQDWWGLIRADGTKRPAYDFLVNRAQALQQDKAPASSIK
jgi:GH35 family endo-1,4-beta-xylanase